LPIITQAGAVQTCRPGPSGPAPAAAPAGKPFVTVIRHEPTRGPDTEHDGDVRLRPDSGKAATGTPAVPCSGSAQEWSDPYEVWLPYWQRFVGGIGFHEATTYLHDAARGSHGCVQPVKIVASAAHTLRRRLII
jgi:hypothetical protein